jgi:hypothetical protein
MEKRAVVVFLILIVLFGVFVLAQEDESEERDIVGELDQIDLGYRCLEDEVEGKNSMSLQEIVFASLALGADEKLERELDDEKKSEESCWPKSSCKIKETAQSLLAYDRFGNNGDKIRDWLLSNEQGADDLIWYLQIDIQDHQAAECTITAGSREARINVNEDMTLNGNTGTCFDIAYGGYWLGIDDRCLDEEFEIKCDNGGDFVTALVYQKNSGGTVYVSSETHTGVDGGTTNEKVGSRCFGARNSCDYEGTLWAALALNQIGEDIGDYVPYLLALADDNKRFFPSAFLYMLVGGDDKYGDVVENQKSGQYWDIVGSPYSRFYDTGLGLLALGGSGADESNAAKDYLLNTQGNNGCWNNNNIRDTALVLYSGWPKEFSGGGGGGGGIAGCLEAGFFCEPSSECLNIGGDVLPEFACPIFRDACCTRQFIEVSCSEKGGQLCGAGDECVGSGSRIESSFDGTCCVGGECVEEDIEDLCSIVGGTCRSGCFDDEIESRESCPDSFDGCCIPSFEQDPVDEGNNYIWIIILVALILLVILGIVFRKKIQFWLHKRRSGKGGPPGRRPPPPRGFGGGGPVARPRPRYGVPGVRAPVNSGPALRTTRSGKTPKDKELEETMKKLREMSK